MAQNNDNSGALFGAKERKSEKSPTHTGKATIGGVEYYISGWKNQSKAGNPYLGLKFESVADAEARRGGNTAPQATSAPVEDDTLPF